MEISACSAKRQFSSRLLAAHSENFFSFSGAILPFFKRQNRAFQGSAERSIRRSKAAYERLRRPYNPLSVLAFMLMLFAFVHQPLSAEKISRKQLKNLKFSSMNESVFVQQDCSFVLTLPGIAPENIQFSIPSEQEYVRFTSSRQTDFIDADRDLGTRIELWFNIAHAGTFTLQPVVITVNGYRYSVPFESVHVKENPEIVLPKMWIVFDSGVVQENGKLTVVAGKPVCFTVYLKFFLQIVKLDWDLQKNSLLKELKRFEITQGKPRNREFFSQEVPVISFEWTPLVSGSWSLPAVKISATKYNGSVVDVEIPQYALTALSNPQKDSGTKAESAENSVFAYAFAESESPEVAKSAQAFSVDDCITLARLRSQERHSFPFSRKASERLAFEQKFGINTRIAEPSIPLFYLCLCLSIVFLIFTVIFIIIRKKTFILFLSLFCVVILIVVVSGIKLRPKYGIFAGGVFSPVPEQTSHISRQQNGGMRVQVIEQTSKWAYVIFNGTGGWVLKEHLFLIN